MRKGFVEPVVLPQPRFRDGLGIRYVRTDGTDDTVEVLRPLWDVGKMQTAIRQRVGRLATFRQARFVPVRTADVPRDDPSTIEVVSDYVSGHRLSQYLEASKAGAVSIQTSAAIHILRELLRALALLHESRGVTHGAVGPERDWLKGARARRCSSSSLQQGGAEGAGASEEGNCGVRERTEKNVVSTRDRDARSRALWLPDEEILKAAGEHAVSLILLPSGSTTPSELSKAAAILLDETERLRWPVFLLPSDEAR